LLTEEERRMYCAGVDLDWGEEDDVKRTESGEDSSPASLTFGEDGAPFIPHLRLSHSSLPQLKPILPFFNR
jgi:hypothetical protein